MPIRDVWVRDVEGELKPQAFLCTDLHADPLGILRWFGCRRSIEVTFAEVRRHLGLEPQRQWSDPAIERTTPALLGLFSLLTLWAHDLYAKAAPMPRIASWYPKPLLTFSNALAAVRRALWIPDDFQTSASASDIHQMLSSRMNSLIEIACHAA